MTYSIETITTLIGAHRIGTADTRIDWLLIDSRSLAFPETTLFFAIRTQKNDGHRYIPELYRRGVRAFVCAQAPEHPEPDANYLVVPSPLRALQRLAERHREEFDIPVVGITGSNGKTIVKEWLYQMLSPTLHVTRSPRSWNSQIGVPLSVWRLSEQTQVGIFEAGISEAGEMASLEAIIQPTIGVLTHLGPAHDENFADREEKCREKLRLFRHARVLIYNADDETIQACVEASGFQGERMGWHRADFTAFLSAMKEGAAGDTEAGTENAIHCICVARCLGLDDDHIREQLKSLTAVGMRLEVREGRHNCTLITDTCNSDLDSLETALDFMRRRPDTAGRRHTLILSDIKQSGLNLTELYSRVAELIQQYGVDELIGIGPEISAGMANLSTFRSTLVAPHLENFQLSTFNSSDSFLASPTFANLRDRVVLIKGARQARFDRITDALMQRVHETTLEVNLSAVVQNLNYYRSFMRPETKMVCMVKASAYGAGAVEIAKTLQDHRVDYLAVAVADEGVELRRAGITTNIMVMNPEMSSFHTLFEYQLEPEVYSFRLLHALIQAAGREGITNFPIHIKLDTGMHRLGFDPQQDLDSLIACLHDQNALIPRSVFTHFVGSDSEDFDTFSARQWEVFCAAADHLQDAFPDHILRHICNTAGITHFPDRHCDMVRLGLGLYGVNPITECIVDSKCIVHSAEVHSDTFAAGNPESQQSLCTMHSSTMHLKDTFAAGNPESQQSLCTMHSSTMHLKDTMHSSTMHSSTMHSSTMHSSTMHSSTMHSSTMHSSTMHLLTPISTLKTTILQIHDVPASDTVGYSRRGHLTRDSRIAALPIGYADGLNRHLGCGHGYCMVNGKKAPYVGNICMDVCMIDVTDIPCEEGDTAVIFGPELPPTVLADIIDTIPYEILTGVSPRVRRVYYVD